MPRFLAGDELGNIKTVYYSNIALNESKTTTKTLYKGPSNSVQALAIDPQPEESTFLAAAFSDGSASAFALDNETSTLKEVYKWKETRLNDDHRYIGLVVSEKQIFSCTSNGALRLTPVEGEGESTTPLLSYLPTRLQDWRMSPNKKNFAYGGEEVDLSVWDTERAFLARPQETGTTLSKKRKRNNTLFPGEIWRAKNIHNDNLGLRQPIRITSLSYLKPTSTTYHLIAGTQFGHLRRYDTRTARRPLSDWKVGTTSGIKSVEQGICENEVFVSDHGYNLFSLDLRNGRIVYGYKGLSGTVTSIAPSPFGLASSSLDRYIRIHSTSPPPPQVGQHQEQRGEVLDKIFMKSTPTVVIWDQNAFKEDDYTPEDDIWEGMEHIEDEKGKVT